jgi:sugar lactone lactonase YvrE
VDPSGNIYILDAGNQRVRRITPDGIITTYAGGGSAVLGDGGPATSGQLNYPNCIAADSAGNIFIGEYGRVRKVRPDGVITTVAGGGAISPVDGVTATSALLTYVPALAVDGAGNLFIGNEVLNGTADTLTYRVFKISPSGVLSAVATPPYGSLLGGVFTYPYHSQMAADRAGDLFLLANTVVWKVAPGGAETVVAGTGASGIGGDGGAANQAPVNSPIGMAADGAGNLYIADNIGRAIRKISADGIIRTIATIGSSFPPPSAVDGSPAISAQLQFLWPGVGSQGNEGGMATDSAGNLYFAETAAGRVRKVSLDGTITTVAGVGGPLCAVPPNCVPLGDGGPATSASIAYPLGVAVDRFGNLFIADSEHALVRKVTPDGTITTVAGNGKWPVYGDPISGKATDIGLGSVYGVALDNASNLLVAANGGLLKVSTDGTISALPVGIGVRSVALDGAGNLFVAGTKCDDTPDPDDGYQNCWGVIEKLDPNGGVTPIAGSSDSPINASSMVVTGTGDLLIADAFHFAIRKIDANGTITTIAGNGAYGYSGDDGPASQAKLSYATGLALDGAGNIYISDVANGAVRVLRTSSKLTNR